MTSLFRARRRAEDFAAAVDGRHDAHRAHGEEITTLLVVVDTLRTQEQVAPRAEFSADLRSRLMVEAATALRPETATLLLPPREPGRRERRLAVAASAFLLVGGTTTMAAASQSALPGDTLYPIKRGIERVEAGFNVGPAGRGSDLLDQATDRLTEVEGLLAHGPADRDEQVALTLSEFHDSAEDGAALLFEAYGASADPAAITEVRTFTAGSITPLEQIAGDVPPAAQDELVAAAVLLHDLDAQAAALCSSCSDLPALEVPGIILARGEVDRALTLAAAHSELNNDHAVAVSEDLLRRVREQATALPDATATPPSAPAAPEDGATAPAAPLETPQWQPEDWPSLLPGLDGSTSGDTGTGGTSPGGGSTLTNPIEELADAIETILPDAGGLLP